MNHLRSGEWPADDDARARLLGVVIEREVAHLDVPHVVVRRSRFGDCDSFSGPYSTGVEALRVALRDQAADEADGSFDAEYDVAPLLPPRGGW